MNATFSHSFMKGVCLERYLKVLLMEKKSEKYHTLLLQRDLVVFFFCLYFFLFFFCFRRYMLPESCTGIFYGGTGVRACNGGPEMDTREQISIDVSIFLKLVLSCAWDHL